MANATFQDQVGRPPCRPRPKRAGASKRTLGALRSGRARHRRDHRRRPLRPHRGRRRQQRRPVGDARLHRGRARLRLRRPLLRRVRVDDPDRRQRVHLRVRDDGRAGRLDHRLGPDPRVRDRRRHGRHRVERVPGQAAQLHRHPDPLRVVSLAVRGAARRLGRGRRARDHEPPGAVHRGRAQRCSSSAGSGSRRSSTA